MKVVISGKVWLADHNAMWLAGWQRMGDKPEVAREGSAYYIDTPHFTVML